MYGQLPERTAVRMFERKLGMSHTRAAAYVGAHMMEVGLDWMTVTEVLLLVEVYKAKVRRQMGKAAMFGMIYGMRPTVLSRSLFRAGRAPGKTYTMDKVLERLRSGLKEANIKVVYFSTPKGK